MKLFIGPRIFLRWLCGLVFVAAAIAKVWAPAPFLEALGQVQWVPEILKPAVAVALPGLELVLGVALIVGWRRKMTARLAFALLLFFTTMLVALPKGTDCGCFGEVSGALAWLSTGVGAIFRNILLLGLTGWLGFFPENAGRPTEEAVQNA